MRLQLISDLHTEFHKRPLDLCKSIEIAPDLDFLVIAGDLVVPARQDINQVHGIFSYFADKAAHVLYVEGNHEFYGSCYPWACDMLEKLLPSNFTWLRNGAVMLRGVHFYGGTMWFGNEDGLDPLFRYQINDWSQISDLTGWVYRENAAFVREGQRHIRPETIVISHHLPHRDSVPALYKEAGTNRFFVSDQSKLIAEKRPCLWLHGHTHHPCDYWLGNTRVVANPYGYPAERRGLGKYPVVLFNI